MLIDLPADAKFEVRANRARGVIQLSVTNRSGEPLFTADLAKEVAVELCARLIDAGRQADAIEKQDARN